MTQPLIAVTMGDPAGIGVFVIGAKQTGATPAGTSAVNAPPSVKAR